MSAQSPSSAPGTSGSPPAPASPTSATTWCAPTSTPRRSSARHGRGPDPRGRASTSSCARASTAAGCRFVLGAATAVRRRRVRLPLRADAPGRGRLGRPLLRRGGGARDRAACSEPRRSSINKSTVPVGSTRVVERGARPRRRARRVQPRVPARGLGRPRLPPPRPHRDRQRRPGAAVRVAALFEHLEAPLIVTDPASAETIKYASNAFLATKVQLRQRHRQRVRGGRRRRARGRARHGLRQAHRLRVPPARPGWGGIVLSRRTRGRWSTSPRTRATTSSCCAASIEVNDEQYERIADKIERAAGGSVDGAHDRGVGPHVQGPHRRPARLARRCT